MKPKMRNRRVRYDSPERELPQLRLADVIDEVSKLAADSAEAARVINRMLGRRAISFAADFDPRTMKLH